MVSPTWKLRVHDLVFAAGADHEFIRSVLETHQHADLGADRLFVEFQRFIAAAVEIQIRLDVHGSLLGIVGWHSSPLTITLIST